jgi:hypothetical protein
MQHGIFFALSKSYFRKINGGIMKKSKPVIASERNYIIEKEKFVPVSEYYGEDTFSHKVMK